MILLHLFDMVEWFHPWTTGLNLPFDEYSFTQSPWFSNMPSCMSICVKYTEVLYTVAVMHYTMNLVYSVYCNLPGIMLKLTYTLYTEWLYQLCFPFLLLFSLSLIRSSRASDCGSQYGGICLSALSDSSHCVSVSDPHLWAPLSVTEQSAPSYRQSQAHMVILHKQNISSEHKHTNIYTFACSTHSCYTYSDTAVGYRLFEDVKWCFQVCVMLVCLHECLLYVFIYVWAFCMCIDLCE